MTCVRRTLCLSEKTNRPPLAKRVENPSPTGSCEGTNFRGGNAPASLKHRTTIQSDTLTSRFPGWKRPGLIEAGIGAVVVNVIVENFRGGNAPASLKLRMRLVSLALFIANFRGGNAPASLKPRSANVLHTIFMAEFPGWKRPGLIEAGFSAR